MNAPRSAVKSAVSPARQSAFKILMAVEGGQAHADDLLRGRAVSALSPPDRHLATTLVLGVLRWQIQLDNQVRQFLNRPNARLDPEVLIALRLGAFQILRLDRIPARAAIDESVELTRDAGHKFASGMVNAVLRKLAAATGPAPQKSAPQNPNPKETQSPSTAAHPVWMVSRWNQFFGEDISCAICDHNQAQPAITIRLATAEAERELTDAGIALSPGQLLTSARIVTAGDIFSAAALREGRVRIQDEGSQLVAELASASVGQKIENILDACAAPGGKTLILAERHPNAHITACEASAPRLETLRERLAPLGPRIDCRLADATALDYESAFDLVLADVPCSGTGTLGRNPEIRHRLTPGELPRQAERQRAILHSALRAVRPGGRVVYSTCSLEPEENEEVVAAILAENPAAKIAPPHATIQKMIASTAVLPSAAESLRASITPQGFLRLLPGTFRSDGFFIAILERA